MTLLVYFLAHSVLCECCRWWLTTIHTVQLLSDSNEQHSFSG